MPNKLELNWIGKDQKISVEPRILIADHQKSYCQAKDDLLDSGINDNMLIHGDNLLALKALESKFAGQVKCIYIDPPYNTGYAFEHYDDNLEHSQWLNLMRPRIELLRNLLSDNGSIWISIDDDEHAYLKVLCDEVFGRRNFVDSVIWEKKYSPQNDAKWLSDSHDYILVYAKNKEIWRPNLLPRTQEMNARYKNPDNDIRGVWKPGDLLRKDVQTSGLYTIITPSGRVCNPPTGRSWRVPEYRYKEMVADNRIWFGKNGDAIPAIKRFLSEVQNGVVCKTIWNRTEVGDNDEAQKEQRRLFPNDPFSTPKPERLLERICLLASEPGDLILDSFLGSGTSIAVAHKMGRRWIGIEMGEHAYTHCKVRIDKVINGVDDGGITKDLKWEGGGGYVFYELADSLINNDSFGEPVINKDYNAEQLAAAVALHEGFTFCPDKECFWKQSIGNENSYLFVTTAHITSQYLDSIHATMKDGEFLIIASKSFDKGIEKAYKDIAVKKIPQMLLERCEFGIDNYNLNIVNPPVYDIDEDDMDFLENENQESAK